MPFSVLFKSTLPQSPTRKLVRTLESLPLRVISVDDAEGRASGCCPTVPLVTLGERSSRRSVVEEFGARAWIAVLAAEDDSPSPSAPAGAFAVLRLPVERSRLLSAVSRCLFVAGASQATARARRPTSEPCALARTQWVVGTD